MVKQAEKLRIAVVTTHPPGKGSLNEYAFYFVNALRTKEEVSEVVLLVDELPDGEYSFDENGAPVTVVPCWEFGAWNNALRIVKAVRQTKPDVVLFNIQFASFGSGKVAASLGLATPALVRAAGVPSVVLLHNIMEAVDLESAGFANNPVIAWVIRSVGTIVTRMVLASNLVALTIPKYVEIIEKKYGTSNVLLAPHGSFEIPPAPNFDPPDNVMRIMTFGKFGTYKKVEVLIEATEILRNNGFPDAELVIAGSDSPNTPGYLNAVAEKYSHVPKVTFLGYVAEEDVPRIFTESSVVVFPYTSTTGSSGVLHQAGGYGRAAVLPEIGDLAELITEEGYGGEFFHPDDAQSLAEAMARVLGDPERRRQLGRQNYVAACGLPIAEVVDWYLLHMQNLL